MIIEGFPEIIAGRSSLKCICCRLTARRPDFVHALHEKHRRGESGSSIHRWAQEYLGDSAPSRGAIRKHLAEHVNFAAAELDAPPIPTAPPPAPAVSPVTEPKPLYIVPPPAFGEERPEGQGPTVIKLPEALRPSVEEPEEGQGPNDELWEIYDSVRDVLRRVQSEILFEQGKLATFQVTAWTSILREGRQLLAGIHQVQTANKTLDRVVQAHTKRFVLAFAAQLERELVPLIVRARSPRTSSQATADALEEFVRVKLGDLIGAAAETALRETREEHRISEVVG